MNINKIPHELIEHTFILLDPRINDAIPSSVCKSWDASKETLLKRLWIELKDQSLEQGCSTIKHKMKKIEQKEKKGKVKYIILFKKLYKKCGPNLTPPSFSETINRFINNQKEMDRNRSLEILLKSSGLLLPRNLYNENRKIIRGYLKNSYNGKTIRKLETLMLSGKLSMIPPEIKLFYNLRRLTILDLHTSPNEEGKLTLPKEIGKLKKLEELTIANTNLEELPPELGKLSNLRELDITYNRVSSIPEEIGKLVNLRKLDLSGNRFLTKLPFNLANLKSTKIILHNTGISPDTLQKDILALNPEF